MRKTVCAAAAATIATIGLSATPAMAGSPDGKIQIKVLGTAVLPDGGIDKVRSINTGTPLGAAVAATPGADVKANDNYVPTLAVEYFFSNKVSVETICCFTQHHVSGAKALAGAGQLVDHVLILPATLSAKYHVPLTKGFKPYVGAGPALFLVFDEKPGATAKALGVDKVKMSNDLGFVLQAGADIALGEGGYSLSLDAKRYFIQPTATFYDGGVKALQTRHDLNPWVLSAGVAYRF